MSDAVERCSVCGIEEPDAALLESCFECNQRFHLNPRSDREGIDCGDAWIGPSLGVQFFCGTCIDGMDPATRGELGDPSQMLAAMLPPGFGGPSAPPPARGAEGAPPPRRARAASQRRYRRIDRG